MKTATAMTAATLADYARMWAGDRQVGVAHFYDIGPDLFSVGYWTPDNFYHQCLVRHDPVTGAFVRVEVQP